MDPIGIEENASVMLCAHRRLRIPYLCAAGIAPPLCVVLSAWTLTETIDNTDFKLNRLTKKTFARQRCDGLTSWRRGG